MFGSKEKVNRYDHWLPRFPFDSNEFTVDNVHPTDLGFYFMANGIYPLLKEILENEKAH
jgi:lysophospholipase L1-like esterase